MERAEQLSRRAREIIQPLGPFCQRMNVAGSLRRGSADVDDIDIVLEPKTIQVQDLFGESTPRYVSLDRAFVDLAEMLSLRFVRGGERMRVYLDPERDCSIDIFIVLPPAQYGALLAIRTGPAAFSHLCMTSRLEGGAMPIGMRQQDGALWRGNTLVETPAEADWFEALGLPYIEPAARSESALKQILGRRSVA